MEISVYEEYIRGVNAIGSISTSSGDRMMATQLIELFKNRPDCSSYVIYNVLEDPIDHGDIVKFYSIKILEDWIALWWNKIGEAEHARIRDSVLMLIGKDSCFKNCRPMKAKIAKLVSEIAKRSFPQKWDTLFNDLLVVCGNDSNEKAEIFLSMIQYLAEDLTDSDFNTSMPTQRRQDIISGITKSLEAILTYSFQFIKLQLDIFVEQANFVLEARMRAGYLCQLALNTSTVLLNICKADEFCTSPHPFQQLCTDIIIHLAPDKIPLPPTVTGDRTVLTSLATSIMTMQHRACELLHGLVEQKHISWELYRQLLVSIPPTLKHLIASSQAQCQTGGAVQVSLESLIFVFRAMAETVFALLINGTAHISHKAFFAENEGRVQVCMDVLLALSRFESLKLSSEAILQWTQIFRDAALLKLIWMQDVATQLLIMYRDKIMELSWEALESYRDEGHQTAGSSYRLLEILSLEFEEQEDFVDTVNMFRQHVKNLYNAILGLYPQCAARFLEDWTLLLIQTSQQFYSHGVSKSEQESKKILKYWADYGYLMESLCRKSSSTPLAGSKSDSPSSTVDMTLGIERMNAQSEYSKTLAKTVNLFLQWNPLEPTVATHYLKCLQNFALHVERSPGAYTTLLAALFNYMDFPNPNNLLDIDSLKSKAAAVVAEISSGCGDDIIALGLFDQLVVTVQELIARGNLSTLQETSMIQTLVVLCSKIPDMGQRTQTIGSILGDTVRTWTSPPVQSVFSSSETMLIACYNKDEPFIQGIKALHILSAVSKKIGLPTLPDEIWTANQPVKDTDGVVTLESGLSRQDLVKLNMATFFPLTRVWSEVLPGVIRAVSSLHGVWDPSFRLQHQSELILATILGKSTAEPKGATSSLSTVYLPALSEVTAPIGALNPKPASGGKTENTEIASGLEDGAHNKYGGLQKHNGDAKKGDKTPFESARNLLSELRIVLYVVCGHVTKQKVVFFPPHISVTPCSPESNLAILVGAMSNTLASLDNRHILQMLKFVYEPFVMNAPPALYDEVSTALSPLLLHMLTRIAVAWDVDAEATSNNVDGNGHHCVDERIFLEFIYRNSSIPAGFGDMAKDKLEVAREAARTMLTRQYTDFLGAVSMTRGFLALAPEEVTEKKQKQRQKLTSLSMGIPMKDKSASEFIDPEDKENFILAKGSAQFLRARRNGLAHLLLGREEIAGPYLMTLIKLLSVPDSNSCRKALEMLADVVERVCDTEDRRFDIPIGRNTFTTVLGLLFNQEKWIQGLEIEIVILLENIYSSLVLRPMPVVISNPNEFKQMKTTTDNDGMALQDNSRVPTRTLCTAPRDVLSTIPGITIALIDDLESQITMPMTKKKRSEVFREKMKQFKDIYRESVGGVSSDSRQTQILNLPDMFSRGSMTSNGQFAKGGVSRGLDVFTLAELFH